MIDFSSRYSKLNSAQKQAVDAIEGPLLVIAGPGTGKTELLSMRAANILKKTDVLPESILCLTFTDSGANAMRERLSQIIGPDAYKVAIHTFHSFGTEIINQHNEYFYRGANFAAADELSSYEILRDIFDELDHDNILSSKFGGDYTYLADASRTISELKQAGISESELLAILSSNEEVLDSIEPRLSEIFSTKISTSMLEQLAPLAEKVAALPRHDLPSSITPLSNILALSMAHAFDEAVTTGKTTALTRWRNEWLEKDTRGTFVFKDRKRIAKLRTLSHVYFSYLARMERAGLYDYDDMILNVINAIEAHPDLRFNLQEKYQYIMVDEFQDTNLAQLRIVFSLTENPANEGSPNIMAVGDDDQAIYSFQGADVNNIHRFRDAYPSLRLITLTENYRSTNEVLAAARSVISLGQQRLEDTIDELDKTLTPHYTSTNPRFSMTSHATGHDERTWIAEEIARQVQSGTSPSDITIIARRHQELVDMVPYLERHGISINYERRDNVLEIPSFAALELVARIVWALQANDHSEADRLMPELLAHPAFEYDAESIWRLSLRSYRNHSTWLEQMITSESFTALAFWLLEQAKDAATLPFEIVLDRMLGVPHEMAGEDVQGFISPLYRYYFSKTTLEENADEYLVNLDALRTIRAKLRDYHSRQRLGLNDFIEFIDLHRDMGIGITSLRKRSETNSSSVNLMTAHKSKGLEFAHVYIMGAVDSAWGERVRVRSRLIGYPANLKIAPAGDTYDERLRLFYVAMTRARDSLNISLSDIDQNGKEQLPASFLTAVATDIKAIEPTNDPRHAVEQSQLDWVGRLTRDVPKKTVKELLLPSLENYKLSATHLNNFLDITRGGPTLFLINNLLHFPSAKSPNAHYGTAMHRALQRAHNHYAATGIKRPVEDILGDFTNELREQHLSEADFETFNKRGTLALTRFLSASYGTFTTTSRTELNFASQGVRVGEARLTGALDLVDIDENSIIVTDYKTGSPSKDWKGKTEFEKIKLHKYRQQLLFYQLLIKYSRDYAKYDFTTGILQFIEPDVHGEFHALDALFSEQELAVFERLIKAVWHSIISLDFPAVDQYDASYKGMLQFEQDLIDNYHG